MGPADPAHRTAPRAGRANRALQVRDQGRALSRAAGGEAASGRPLFRFTQVEYPWALGPPDGRYLLRSPDGGPEGEPEHVLVLATLGAAERRRFAKAKRQAQVEPEPTPVSTGRATVIEVESPFATEAVAKAWLNAAGESDLEHGISILNRALHGFRLVTADPYVYPVGRRHALVARVGYGAGEQVADGQWTDARELVPTRNRQPRAKVLHPQARLAALLGGRERALACEELALRCHLDLDQGRDREAALQVLVALDAALAELQSDPTRDALADRLAELRGQREAVVAAAQTALGGQLSTEQRETVAFTLSRIEAALRARAVANA